MRRPLQAALTAVALLLATACSGGSTDGSEEGWSFTDDMGTKISLDAVPERIVAYKGVAAALADMGLGDRVVGVFGEPTNPDPDLGLQSPELDVSTTHSWKSPSGYDSVAISVPRVIADAAP